MSLKGYILNNKNKVINKKKYQKKETWNNGILEKFSYLCMREVHHVDKTIRFSYSPNQEVRRIGIVLQASMHLARNNLLQL